jgi:hypothetical protein
MWRKQGWLGRAVRTGRIVFDPAWNLDGSVNKEYATRMRKAADRLDAASATVSAVAPGVVQTANKSDTSSDEDEDGQNGLDAADMQQPLDMSVVSDDRPDPPLATVAENKGTEANGVKDGADESAAGVPPLKTLQTWIDEVIANTEPSKKPDTDLNASLLEPNHPFTDITLENFKNIELNAVEMKLTDSIIKEDNAPLLKRALVILLVFPHEYFENATPDHAKRIMQYFVQHKFRRTQLLRMIYYTSRLGPDDATRNFDKDTADDLRKRIFETWNSTEMQWNHYTELNKNATTTVIGNMINAAASPEQPQPLNASPDVRIGAVKFK